MNDLNGKKLLVTGGLGFIGSNLVPMLRSEGAEVRVLDNYSRIAVTDFPDTEIEILNGDIRSEEDIAKAVVGMDAIVHLAAYGSVIESIVNPMDNFDINVRGTLNVLNQARLAKVARFIFASTGGALIGNAEPPVDENSVPRPISPYGASKLCCEAYCSGFSGSYDIHTTMLRFANVYGFNSDHKKGAITVFCKAILNNEPIVIYGDGSSTRDILHVSDLCRGITLTLQSNVKSGTAIHLASGVETSIKEMAELLIEVSGVGSHVIQYKDARRGEVNRNFASYERAKELIGFQPQIDIRDGFASCYKWFQDIHSS